MVASHILRVTHSRISTVCIVSFRNDRNAATFCGRRSRNRMVDNHLMLRKTWSELVIPETVHAGFPMKKARGTLQQRAYQRIKEYILNTGFYPGQHIRHVEVSRALGMSRTPAREAMQRLVEEGLVIHVPNRGYFVTEMTVREAEELYELREILEVFCVQQAIDKSTKKQLRGLRQLLDVYKDSTSGRITRHTLLVDRDFHLKIAQLARNEMVYKLLVSVLEKVIMKRNIERIAPSDAKTAFKRHAVILKAIENRDKPQAVQQIREHIRHGKMRVLQQVNRKNGLWLGNAVDGAHTPLL